MTEDFLAALERALAQAATEWNDAPITTGSLYDLPPDGEYQALIQLFEFVQYKEGKGIGLKVTYQITNNSLYAGRLPGDLMTISPEKIGRIKSFLATMGVEVDGLNLAAELRPGSATLEKLLDTPVMIKIRRSQGKGDHAGKTFENVYLQYKIGEWGSGATGPGNPGTGGFTPTGASDVTPSQAGFDFAPAPAQSRAQAPDDDIPF